MAVRELTPDEIAAVQAGGQPPAADMAATTSEDAGDTAGPSSAQTGPASRGVRELTGDELDQVEPDHGAAHDIAMSVGGGFLRGVSDILGLPADLGNAAANALGLPGASRDAILGSRWFQRRFNDLDAGLAPDQPYPSPAIGKASEIIGGSVVPFGAMGLAARTGAEGGMLTKPFLEAFRSSPKSNALGELGAATGAGIGGGAAQAVDPNSETAQIIGQLIGGFASPLSVATRSLPAVGKGARKAAEPFLPGGAQRQAARQLKQVVEDPKAAAAKLSTEPDATPGAQLTPAQETQDPGLLRLERSLIRGSADIEGRHAELADATNRSIMNEAGELAGTAPLERTREHLEDRLGRLSDAMDARGAQALERARRRAQELTPAMRRRGEASKIVREEIENALHDAQGQERDLWDAVPKDATTSTDNLKRTYQGLLEGQRKSDDPANVPPWIHRLLGSDGSLGDQEPVEEVQALRSRLLHGVRDEEAKDAPNRRKTAALERLQRAALDDLGANTDDTTDAGQAIKHALAFSKDLNQRFRQGPVGKILSRDRRGGPKVAPENTLAELLTREGTEGGTDMAALSKALRDVPDAQSYRDAAADFIRGRFAQQATDDRGAVRPPAAKRFLNQNHELLQYFPDLRRELADTEQAQRSADDISNRMQLRKRGLLDKRTSRASMFLNAPVGKEINRVLRSRSPVASMKQLKAQVRNDPTGESLQGLKGQFLRDMMGRSELDSFETQGHTRASGGDMEKFAQQHKGAMEALFSPDELGRIRRVIGTAKKLDRAAAQGRNIDDLLDESPDMIIDLASRIAGANLGARGAAGSAGAPLVAAGAGSRFVRRLTNRIPVERTRDVLSQAMLDRDLMRTLLKKVDSPKQRDALQRRLNGFLVNLAPDANGDHTEDGQGLDNPDQSGQ